MTPSAKDILEQCKDEVAQKIADENGYKFYHLDRLSKWDNLGWIVGGYGDKIMDQVSHLYASKIAELAWEAASDYYDKETFMKQLFPEDIKNQILGG